MTRRDGRGGHGERARKPHARLGQSQYGLSSGYSGGGGEGAPLVSYTLLEFSCGWFWVSELNVELGHLLNLLDGKIFWC